MAALLFSCWVAFSVAAQASQPVVTVEGTSFVLRAADGRVLRSPDLAGTVLGIEMGGGLARVCIDHVERDPDSPRVDIWLHRFSFQQPDGAWQPLCAAGPDGRTQGFPLAGRTLPNGSLDRRDPSAFELTCTAGAQAKCVRYGYAPWALAPDGTSLHKTHSACVAMLRGDYAGDGSATTSDGSLVGITDRWSLRALEPREGHPFEAGWDAEGAVCVRHARIRGNVDLSTLEARVARLKGRTGAACTPEFARSLGALILNWSRAE